MADTSLIIGNGNWAVKETSLLGYNIIQSKYVPIEMTVSRNTTATRVNNAGLIELVPRNLLTYSQQIDNADWVKINAPTITTNIAVAPDGTTTADGIKADDAVNFKSISQTKTVTANSTVTSSVFVKKETSETNFGGFAYIFTGVTTKILRVTVNAVTGTVQLTTDSTLTGTTKVEDYGAYWRISATTTDNGSNTSLQYAYYGTLSTNGTNTVQAVGSVRTVWGFQLEIGPTATEYFPTTDRFNIPRVDYSTGTASLLVEPVRTNSLLYSEQFDNVVWIKPFATITANVTTAPDGTMTADLVTPTISDSSLRQGFIPTGAIQYNFSIYLRSATGSNFSTSLRAWRNVVFQIASTVDINVTTEWQRFNLTFTTFDITEHTVVIGGGYTLSTGENFYAWGAQLEAGSNATSYIPTTTGTVSRAADVISKTGISSLIGQTEGTMFVDFNFTQNVNTSRLISIGDGTTNNRAFISLNANTIEVFIRNASAIQYSVSSSTILTGRYKVAVRYKQNDFGFYINGVPINTSNSGNLPINLNNFYLATPEFAATATSIQSINSAQIYKTALDNDQCIDLTKIT